MDQVSAILEIEKNKSAYNTGKKPLPLIAQKFIEMGNDIGIDIEVVYGTNQIDIGIMAGYWIFAPKKKKAIFLQDIEIG